MQLVHLLAQTGQSKEVLDGALAILARAQLIGKGTTAEQFFNQLKQAILDPKNREVVQKLWPFLQGGQQGGLNLEMVDSRTLIQLLLSRL